MPVQPSVVQGFVGTWYIYRLSPEQTQVLTVQFNPLTVRYNNEVVNKIIKEAE